MKQYQQYDIESNEFAAYSQHFNSNRLLEKKIFVKPVK